MKKIIVIGLATAALSISPALAKKHAAKPKAPAPAAATMAGNGIIGQPSPADKAMYMKNKHDSGIK